MRSLFAHLATGTLLLLSLLNPLHAQKQLKLNLPGEVPCLKCDWLSEKLSSELEILWHLNEEGIAPAEGKNGLPFGMILKPQKVYLDILTQKEEEGLIEAFEGLGLTGIQQFGHLTNGWLSIDQLPILCELSEVVQLRACYQPITGIGRVSSQGDEAQNSLRARNSFDLTGAGVKVGVLSDSYNNLNGERAGILAGELPGPNNPNGFFSPVQVVEDLGNGGSDEGRGMLEIIHDVAPGAELAFATAFGGQAGFANNILALQAVGCDVIVDDVRFFADPFFQDGIIAQAADSSVDLGATYFSSAGNQGRESYEANFRPGERLDVNFGNSSLTYTTHNFGEGDNQLNIRIPTGAEVTLVLQWDDPFASVSGNPGALSDIDFFLLDEGGNSILASSTTNNRGADPVEIIQFENNTSSTLFNLIIASEIGLPTPSLIKFVTFGQAEILEFNTNSSTLFGQANASKAIAVGAAFWGFTPAFGVDPPQLEAFSSAGGTPILFDRNGNRISQEIRRKPEVTGPDGGNTSFFGSDIGFDDDLFPNFFGTSASAPHLAGVAALMKESNPLISPSQLLNLLQSTAIDMGLPGFDFDSGMVWWMQPPHCKPFLLPCL